MSGISISKPMFSNYDTNGKTIYPKINPELDSYENMGSLITIINNVIIDYVNGNFSKVIQFVQSGQSINIATNLNNIISQSYSYPDIQNTAKYNINILNAIEQDVNQYRKLQIAKEETSIYKQDSITLRTPSLLNIFIANQEKQITGLPNMSVTVVAPSIKKEYIIYINKYGMPPNGLFDVGLLADIIQSLL